MFVLDKEVRLTRFDAIADSLMSATQPLTNETPSLARIEVEEDSEDDVVIRRHLRRVKSEPEPEPDPDQNQDQNPDDLKQDLEEEDNEEGIPTEELTMPYESPSSLNVGEHCME